MAQKSDRAAMGLRYEERSLERTTVQNVSV